MTDRPVRRMVPPDPATAEWVLAYAHEGCCKQAKVVEVIEVETVTGIGIEGSPVKVVTDWFLTDGRHIGHYDPSKRLVGE